VAWTYEQLFNGLNDGDLNTQDSWSGDTSFDVQTTEKYEGAKAVSAVTDGNIHEITRSITSISAGSVYVAIRASVTTLDTTILFLEESPDSKMFLGCKSGYFAIYDNSAGWVNIQTYNANQWYVANIEFNNSTQPDEYRIRIHDGTSWGTWTGWKTVSGGSYTNIDGISFYHDTATATIWWDTITPTDPVPATTTTTSSTTTSTTSSSTTTSTTSSTTSTTSTTTSATSTTSTTTSATSTTSTTTSATSTTSTTSTSSTTSSTSTTTSATSTTSTTSSTSSTSSSTSTTSTSTSTSSTSSSTSTSTSTTTPPMPFLIAKMDISDFKPIMTIKIK